MRYCNNCNRFTAGRPLFCPQCGASYNVKLCPRSHQNPRSADVCSECGSRDLSTPHRKLPLAVRLLFLPFRIGFGWLLLFLLLIWSFFYVEKLLANPDGLLPLMLVGLGLGLLLYGYISLKHGSKRKTK